jgi:hypothetical protein
VFLRFLLGKGAIFGFAAEHRFIALDHTIGAADWPNVLRRHCFANAMAHKPCGPVRAKAEHTPELTRTHTLLAGAHEVCGKKPLMHGDMRTFVNRANRGGELLYALTAAIEAVTGSFANDRIG